MDQLKILGTIFDTFRVGNPTAGEPTLRDEGIRVTSVYGPRSTSINPPFHPGIDYAPRIPGQPGVAVYPTGYGEVISVREADALNSLRVTIKHWDGYYTSYSHLDSTSVAVGDFVNPWRPIGIMGNTGAYSTGIHLHYELHTPGQVRINPRELFGAFPSTWTLGSYVRRRLDGRHENVVR